MTAPGNANQHSVLAVTDSGAQVCVAGCQLINDLGLSRRDLQHPGTPIKYLTGGHLHVLGSSMCTFRAEGCSTQACLYFTEGIEVAFVIKSV